MPPIFFIAPRRKILGDFHTVYQWFVLFQVIDGYPIVALCGVNILTPAMAGQAAKSRTRKVLNCLNFTVLTLMPHPILFLMPHRYKYWAIFRLIINRLQFIHQFLDTPSLPYGVINYPVASILNLAMLIKNFVRDYCLNRRFT